MPKMNLDQSYLAGGKIYPAGEQDVPDAVATKIKAMQKAKADAAKAAEQANP